MNNKLKTSLKLIASMLLLQTMVSITADDTEMFQAEQSSERKPNLLFVMDVSGSMDKEMNPNDPASKTRLATMQSALRLVLDSAPKNLNVGLMEYGELKLDYGAGQYPSGISFPVSDIEAKVLPIVRDSITVGGHVDWWRSKTPEPTADRTVRDYISDITDLYFKDSWYKKKYGGKTDAQIEMPRYGNTPIVDALYEAARYFRGDKVYFGHNTASQHKKAWSLARAAVPSSYEGDPTYWEENRCHEGTTFSTSNLGNWEGKGFWDENFADRWNGSWSDNKCAVDLQNPNATPITKAACKTHEICNSKMEGYEPERLAQAAVQGTWTCDEKRYGPWYCPKAKKTDENGTEYCPVYNVRDRKYPDGCYWKGAKNEVTYRAEIPAKKYWTCKVPRCTGAITDTPKYISPIKNVCQSNFIVLMSDGKPEYSRNYDTHGNRDGTNTKGIIASRLDWGYSNVPLDDKKSGSTKAFKKGICKNHPSGYASGKCGPELTEFLATSDQMGGAGFEGTQTVNTFAIGFGLDPNEPKADEYLESLVTTDINPDTGRKYGYFTAQDEVTLAAAFDSIVRKIGVTTDALAASGYSVNVKNGVSHENKIYIPVFRRKETPTWTGNLKKFEIKTVGAVAGVGGKRKIVDKNNKVAMSELGVFKADIQDLWSTTIDGAKVEAGGVASLLKDADNRKLLTNSGIGNVLEDLKVDNGNINYSTLGLGGADATVAHRKNLIRFIRGERYDTDKKAYVQRKHMGDMMHSDPAVVTYDDKFETSGKKAGQVLYIGTNEGYLHAFDTVTGEEIFAFMPEILLKNIDRQYKNSNADKHIYGVDGAITVWNKIDHKDASKNKHYIYFGLRRGGRAYYALDVTNPIKPKLMWKLNRHTSYKGAKVFGKIGQTWSKAVLGKIRTNKAGDQRPIIAFSGGYDINQDLYADSKLNAFKDGDPSKGRLERKAADNIGKDIYIVDAEKGPKGFSWSMNAKAKGASAIKHSIPGGLRMVDMNQDGAADRIYFADMGGNVWRLQLPKGPDFDFEKKDESELIKFASLGDATTGVEGRKFYNEPDVALLTHKGKKYISIAIGSGYRAHPLYEKGVKNKFFVLIDQAVFYDVQTDDSSKDHYFEMITSGKLDKLVASISGGSFSLTAGGISNKKNIIDLVKADKNIRGWSMELPSKGEKVLATSITRDGNLVFTTLAPNTEGEGLGTVTANGTAEGCGAPRSQGRAYVLDLLTAKESKDVNEDGLKTGDGAVAETGYSGGTDIMTTVSDNTIPNTPTAIFNEPSCNHTTKKCTQEVDIRIDKKSSALMPEQLDYLERRYWSDPVIEGE